MAKISDKREFLRVNIAVLTVSDTRTLDDDRSGDMLADRLDGAGHVLAAREIVKDDIDAIAADDAADVPALGDALRSLVK